VLPVLKLVDKAKVPNAAVDLDDYSMHAELATHYPLFLRDQVKPIVLGLKYSTPC